MRMIRRVWMAVLLCCCFASAASAAAFLPTQQCVAVKKRLSSFAGGDGRSSSLLFMSAPIKDKPPSSIPSKDSSKNETTATTTTTTLLPPEQDAPSSSPQNGFRIPILKRRKKIPKDEYYQEEESSLKASSAKESLLSSLSDERSIIDVMDGGSKKEEPGDRDEILTAIRQIQYELYLDEPKIPTDTIVERTLDTVEDAVVHLRRVPYDLGWIKEDEMLDDRPTIVILGSGWAAHALLKVTDTFKMRIIVVSPSNHFVFTPMLASASVGTVEYRSMTEAIRASNPMIDNYLEGEATDIDIEKKTLKIKLEDLLQGIREGESPEVKIKYDKLIVAVGCKVADSMVPGAFKNSLRLKSCDDARKLRNAIGEALEYASRPCVKDDPLLLGETEWANRREERRRRLTFAIVGGGPTGVELAGELADFIQDITKPRVGAYPTLRDDVRIVLIHSGEDLVPQFDEALRKHALQSLQKSGVEVRLMTRVNEVGDGFVKLIKKGEGKQEETLYTGLNVWAAGTEPVPFVEKLLEKLPESARGPEGKIIADRWLRCSMPDNAEFGSILVMGDAAAFAEDRGSSFLPQTAQVAGQQGAYAARLLDREYDLSVTPPQIMEGDDAMKTWLKVRGLERANGFKFLNLGLLAYVGGGEALTQVQIGDVPIFSYAGSISFVLWRSVYLVKQVATRNRVLVTFDWVKSSLFGRDITRL